MIKEQIARATALMSVVVLLNKGNYRKNIRYFLKHDKRTDSKSYSINVCSRITAYCSPISSLRHYGDNDKADAR